jgi:hypothetical protein
VKTLAALFESLRARRMRKSVQPVGGYQPKAVACWTCNLRHELPRDVRQALQSAEDFFSRHLGHLCDWHEQAGIAGLSHSNADVKQAFGTDTAFSVTNLHSLASSPTAGWQSAVVDNTAALYLDELIMVTLDFANTAPGSSKAVYFYAYGGTASGVYTYPCSGTQGTLTLSDITANPTAVKRIGRVPYLVQDAVQSDGPWSVAAAFGGTLPPYWGTCCMNHSGAALAASLNVVNHRPVFLTIV